MPMKIVFDTNILFDKWYLDGPQFELLRRHVASGRSAVVIPSVVVLEMKNNYLKETSKLLSAVEKLNPMLPEGYAPLSCPSPAVLSDEYLVQLRARIGELGFKEIDADGLTHERFMEKSVKKQKPFKEGGSGYQDCLIWETILRKVANAKDITYLVTKNCKDFAAEDKQTLHPDLLQDMRNHRLPEDRIQYIPDLKTLIDSYIIPEMSAVETDEKLSAFGSHLLDDDILTDWISDNINEIMKELNKGHTNLLENVIHEAETVDVSYLDSPESFEIDSISEIDNETAMVVVMAAMDATVSFFLFRNEYMMFDPPYPFAVMDSNWNNHYIWAETEVRLTLRFVFSVSLETDEVLDFEVENETQLWGYCRRCGAIEYNEAAEECSSCNRPYGWSDTDIEEEEEEPES